MRDGSRKPPKCGVESPPVPYPRTATRTKFLKVRVTPEEADQIRAQAKLHGMGFSAYLRALALNESFRRAHVRYVGHLSAKLAGFERRFTRPGEEV
jgi:hypothetical protein